jgi:hypothetical protein
MSNQPAPTWKRVLGVRTSLSLAERLRLNWPWLVVVAVACVAWVACQWRIFHSDLHPSAKDAASLASLGVCFGVVFLATWRALVAVRREEARRLRPPSVVDG